MRKITIMSGACNVNTPQIEELAAPDSLEVLRRDYVQRFAAMQTDKARKAYEDAFDTSSEELGKAPKPNLILHGKCEKDS